MFLHLLKKSFGTALSSSWLPPIYFLYLKAFTWSKTIPAMSVRTLRETVEVGGRRRWMEGGRKGERERGKERGACFLSSEMVLAMVESSWSTNGQLRIKWIVRQVSWYCQSQSQAGIADVPAESEDDALCLCLWVSSRPKWTDLSSLRTTDFTLSDEVKANSIQKHPDADTPRNHI